MRLGRIRLRFPIRNALLFTGVILLFALLARGAIPMEVPNYAVGDRATNDIVTPIPLIIVDSVKTETLRTQEAQRIPTLVRFFPETALLVESNFHTAFSTNRENFFNALQAAYKQPTLNTQLVAQPRFQRFALNAQKQARPFPLTTNLAEAWALGDRSEVMEAEFATVLRATMARYIRIDALPPEAKGPSQWRLFSESVTGAPPELDLLIKQASPVQRTNIHALLRVKKDLVSSFQPQQQALAKYLASFLTPNCVVDGELTRLARAARTNILWSASNYQPGQTILKAGDAVDARAKAALDQLREKLSAERTQTEALEQAQKAASALQSRVLAASIIGAALLALGITFWLFRRGPQTMALQTLRNHAEDRATDDQGALVAGGPTWRIRALTAERRAAKLTHAIRIRLAPHLARWLAYKFVQQLLSHRKNLIEVQSRAEAEINELEQRLEQIRAPLEERVKAYENRILQLEKQLEAKTEQNRELIRMTIATARKKLELTQAKAATEWN